MLDPDYFNGKSDLMVEMYQDLEDWIMKDIAMRLIKSGEVAGTTNRELWKLEQMGLQRKEILKRLSILSGKSTNELRELLTDATMTSYKSDRDIFEQLGIEISNPLENALVMETMNAEFLKTQGELSNLTRTTMLQANNDLVNLLNEADLRVATGMQSYTSAVCDVLDNYAKAGMIIMYPTGTRRSLEAAVRMCVVTSMNQMAGQVTNSYIAQEGIEYVRTSAHYGARPGKDKISSHETWQGHVFKIVGSEPGYPNLEENTGYRIDRETGQGYVVDPRGLHGYNCRHSHQPWDKSLRDPGVRVDQEESSRIYDLQQQQRGMERSIRQQKREVLMKQYQISDVAETDVKDVLQEEYDRLAFKLKQKNAQYREFCSENDLQPQSDRLKIAGFHRSQASKANARARAYEKLQT